MHLTTPQTNPVEVAIRNSDKAVEGNKMGKMLCQLVKQKSAPTVDIRWESFAIYLFHVSVSRGGGEENCQSTR